MHIYYYFMIMNILYTSSIITPIGILQAVADEKHLIILQFIQNSNLATMLKKLQNTNNIVEQKNKIIERLEQELLAYFQGNLTTFTIPTKLHGTDFQKKCWNTLQKIPYGSVTNYKHQAEFIHRPKAYRAVGNANKNNPIAIIYPCHRVIKSDGNLCGYNGGLDKKQALLHIEKNCKNNSIHRILSKTSLKNA